jgi:hypothetical protein
MNIQHHERYSMLLAVSSVGSFSGCLILFFTH